MCCQYHRMPLLPMMHAIRNSKKEDENDMSDTLCGKEPYLLIPYLQIQYHSSLLPPSLFPPHYFQQPTRKKKSNRRLFSSSHKSNSFCPSARTNLLLGRSTKRPIVVTSVPVFEKGLEFCVLFVAHCMPRMA